MGHPRHLPVTVFHVSHEMLKDWFLEPDLQDPTKSKKVLVVRQAKFDGESATVKCIRIPQDQWPNLVHALQDAMEERKD